MKRWWANIRWGIWVAALITAGVVLLLAFSSDYPTNFIYQNF